MQIHVESVNKSYATPAGAVVEALRDVSLDVAPGEFVTLIGPSGCGKTTLLKVLAGLVPWDTGQVTIGGRPITGPGPERAMVFQHFALLPWSDVLTNVNFGLDLRGVARAERDQIGRALVEKVGLRGFEHRYPRELSGGMQQRVGLARALAVKPQVLLMDEPFGALDAQTRRLMQEELLRLHESERKTTVFVTHSMDEAIRLGDRVVVMGPRPGRVVEVIPVPFARPRPEGFERRPEFVELEERLWTMLRQMMTLDG